MSGAEKTESQPGKKLDLGKFVLPLFAVINIAVVGGGGFLTYQATLGWHPPVVREPAALKELKAERDKSGIGEAVAYTMPSFTVNLAGSPRRYIRVEMTVEMLDKEGYEEVVRNNPVARDQIVRILNRKTFDEIETIQGKLHLKEEIALALNENLKEGVVKDIFFSEFLVQ